MSAITIVAGGYSAKLCNLVKLPGTVIAVNDAAIYAPRVDLIVSMDRLWTEGRFDAVSKFGKPLWLRHSTLRNVKWEGNPCVTPFECDHESITLSDEPGVLNGTHSGFCAINLAYSMRPRRLYLVGLDFKLGPKGERHWFPDYPWKSGGGSKASKLGHWENQFRIAARQLAMAGIETRLVSKAGTRMPFVTINPAQLEAECR